MLRQYTFHTLMQSLKYPLHNLKYYVRTCNNLLPFCYWLLTEYCTVCL